MFTFQKQLSFINIGLPSFSSFLKNSSFRFIGLRSFSSFRENSSPWFYFPFPVGSDYLSHLNRFQSKLVLNQRYFLLVKIQNDDQWLTLHSTIVIDSSNFDSYKNDIVNIIINGINKFSSSYDIRAHVHTVNLAYCEVNSFLNTDHLKPQFNRCNNKVANSARIRSEFLTPKYFPFSLDTKDFGSLISRSVVGTSYTETYRYSEDVYLIHSYDSAYKVDRNRLDPLNCDNSSFYESQTTVRVNNHNLFTFYDYALNDSTFERCIDNLRLYFSRLEPKHIYSEHIIKFPKISSLKRNPKFKSSFLTLDIETYLDNNVHIPYLIGFYDGITTKTFYLSDYTSPENMLVDCLNHLLLPKYRNKVVYIHNLARFDGVFLLKFLYPHFKVKPLIKDNKIYSISIRTIPNTYLLDAKKVNNVTIYLQDSYLMLPLSLRKLCSSFNVKTQKSYFPYRFVTANNLNYIGLTPDLKFYDDLPADLNYSYNSVPNWNLKVESINYLTNDLKSLYEVIEVFSYKIFGEYVLDIKDYLTLPSLAFAIFRSNFFDKAKNMLPIINKSSRFKFVEESYYGGSVDIIKPTHSNVYCYDVNSLYPSSMLQKLPVGDGYYSTDPNLDNWFGFLKVKVTCPDNLKVPILPFRKDDGTVIHPIGQWTGVYFSEELKNAVKYGYSFEILEGLKFEQREDIFKDYVEHFYKHKISDDSIFKFISKLLLNSLYGRFGMKNLDVTTSIVNHDEAQYILSKYDVLNHVHNTGDVFEIIKYSRILRDNKNYIDEDVFQLKGSQYIYSQHSNVVASAITAYGRIFMSQFKNIKDNELLYTDTDSLFLEKPLPSELVGPELGKFKLEHVCQLYFAINPKVYLLLTKDNIIIRKTAGFNYALTIDNFESLLNYNTSPLNILNSKWNKRLTEGSVNIITLTHFLSPQHSKRIPLYNSKGVWYDTKPFKLVNGSIVNFLPVIYQPHSFL